MKRGVQFMIRSVEIKRWESGDIENRIEPVAVEYPLTVYLNGHEWLTLLCSPDSLEALVYGFLASEGLIKRVEDVDSLAVDSEKGHCFVKSAALDSVLVALHGKRMQTSGCAKGTTFYNALDHVNLKKPEQDVRISIKELSALMHRFNGESSVFRETGGVHSCALCVENQILFFKEDIGRHNALDKLIGEMLLSKTPLGNQILLTSGRISSEILLKSARAGLSVIASRSAPTDMAVREAEKLGMTVIGFMRGTRCNVYSGAHRLQD